MGFPGDLFVTMTLSEVAVTVFLIVWYRGNYGCHGNHLVGKVTCVTMATV